MYIWLGGGGGGGGGSSVSNNNSSTSSTSSNNDSSRSRGSCEVQVEVVVVIVPVPLILRSSNFSSSSSRSISRNGSTSSSNSTVLVPTGAFVCHRQNTPRTNTTHSSAATQFKQIRTLQLSGPWSRSSLGFGSRDRCCAGNILVESSSPEATGHWRSAANPSAFFSA